MSTSIRPIVVAALAVPLLAFGSPPSERPPAGSASAATLPTDVPLQPGAPMIAAGAYFRGSVCTLNFVFKDKAKETPETYIGAGGCAGGAGTRASAPQVGAFGTVVHRNDRSAGDFALIRIDRDKLKYVSRVMRGFGAAPTGYTTSGETNAGDLLVTHGYPYAPGQDAQGVTRTGLLGNDTSTRYWSSVQPNIQDSGSPVIRADGKAVGISDEMTSFWGTWLPKAPPMSTFPTIEGLLLELRSHGFNVTL